MALTRMKIDGYGQVELNQVAFRRDGRIEAQCALGEDFDTVPAENGMLLAVDNVNGVVKFPESGEKLPIALNYTSEHMYDDRANALKDFKLEKGSFYPRLGYLSIGDKFTTNCLSYDSDDYTNDQGVIDAYKAATLKTTPMYGVPCENGTVKVVKTAPESGLTLAAVLGTGAGSMPDGQFGIKFQVIAL